MSIYEKLAKCSSPGEVARMMRGNGMRLVNDAGLPVAFDDWSKADLKPHEIELRQWCVDQAARVADGAVVIDVAKQIHDWINGK